eukprot:gene13388-17786_t
MIERALSRRPMMFNKLESASSRPGAALASPLKRKVVPFQLPL